MHRRAQNCTAEMIIELFLYKEAHTRVILSPESLFQLIYSAAAANEPARPTYIRGIA